ncbi:MAG: sigma-54-dependent Fis family transcriptional regulator [Enterobacterales bacterium]|nr:sigma-54-dependent Fis family transcriptional regulator [Enterobacterales bacterium]
MNAKALIIDDEPDILSLLGMTLQRMDIDTDTAENVSDAKQLLEDNEYDFCLSDMRLPDGDGMEIVDYVQHNTPQTPIAIITAHGNMELGVEAMKSGAFDFVSKPVDLNRLRSLVSAAILIKQSRSNENQDGKQLIGNSLVMKELNQTIDKLSYSQAPVYISGESGSGKELVARLIHERGGRGSGPFIPVNCSAIPTELMESEFFGHTKGSFTGAVSDKKGLFVAANGGTLFLDEVADLPMDMQVKLLRAIQEHAIRPVGQEQEIAVDVRILSATHKQLSKLVSAGDFRQDLYYRINVIEIKVPALRERADDIPLIADFLMQKLNGEHSNFQLSADALQKLQNYHFPGNVRELENILERATTLCSDHRVGEKDIALPEATPQEVFTESDVVVEKPSRGDLPLEEYMEGIEREAIEEALVACRWNKTAAAKKLGISFRALRYKLEKYNIE